MTPAEEHELLLRIKEDRNLFAHLFDEYYNPIIGYIYRRVNNYDLAKDIAAETFMKAFLNIEKFTWKGVPILSWLLRIATNETNQYFRKRKYLPQYFSNILNTELIESIHFERYESEKTRLEEELAHHKEFAHVQKILNTLDIKYQEVIALKYFEEKTIKEISEILLKPEGTIKSLHSRGLEKLRKKFEKTATQ